MDQTFQYPSHQIADTMSLVYQNRLTTTSGGNISIKEENGDIWISPGAVDKGILTAKDIVKVRPDGTYEGLHKPSSELPFHRAIYQSQPDIKVIIHAHPPALVSFSIVGKVPATSVIPQAMFLCGSVGFAPYALLGSEALGKSIADEFGKGYNTVIMENHGTVVGGATLIEAFMRFETLEFCARMLIKSSSIGEPKLLDKTDIQEFESRNNDLEEFVHKPPSVEERGIRHQIVQFIQRACQQGLMISSYGTISARVNAFSFIINPTGRDRRSLSLSDLVRVEKGKREAGKLPSRAVRLHQQIYSQHPDVACIISTQSPNATAYCIAGQPMDTRTIPEIPLLPYKSLLGDRKAVADQLGKHIPIVMIQNDSILVTGTSVLETFDRLEVVEFSATSLINSRGLGKVKPIQDAKIQELKYKFFPKE